MLFSPKEKGQGLVEYALILVLVAVLVIAVLVYVGLEFFLPLLKQAWENA